MCGIAGIFNLNNSPSLDIDLLKRMVMVQEYRGPDEQGIYIDNHIGLGHTRLSIIDLSHGTQPIHNEDKTLWITYNGEIYNYLELRIDLEKKGHQFYTDTDTEVILHQFEEYKYHCLETFNGQFAFAIWDNSDQSLFLARDRVGIRPLFYTQNKTQFYFASEIKALFQDPNIPREINPFALDQIFTFWTTLPGYTAFQDIHEVPPGHYMVLSGEKQSIQRYWEIPFSLPDTYRKGSASDYISKIQELLMDAVRIRLRADVEVGTYLSGGIDSTGISALVRRHFNQSVRTFGIRFEESKYDEGREQEIAVQFLKTKHHSLSVSNEAIGRSVQDTISHCENPILRTAPIPLYLLSQLVHDQQIKVVLTGEGADEVFGGYNIFREAKVRSFWAKQPQSTVRPKLIEKLYPYLFQDAKHKSFLYSFFEKGLTDIQNPFYSHLIRWQNTSRIKLFFSKEIQSALQNYDCTEELKQHLPDDYDRLDIFTKAQYLETMLFLSQYLLSSQGDRMAMAHSVEIRLPFLDHRILEFVGQISPHHKMPGLNEKNLLKKCFRDDLPEEIVLRNKRPYRAPIRNSLLHPSVMEENMALFSEKSIRESGFFKHQKIDKLIQKIQHSDQTNEVDDMALMGIFSTQSLFKQMVKQCPVSELNVNKEWHVVDFRESSF